MQSGTPDTAHLPWLTLEDVTIAYPGIPGLSPPAGVVHGLSFRLPKGDIGCLLGPSGCGKTTALRAIAGLMRIQQGRILIGSNVVSDGQGLIPPERRRVGFVFQDHALFPHLTVAENVAFGLRHLSRRERRTRVMAALERVGLADQAGRHPYSLSGGQQQRIALVRALVTEPDLLLMDEPFSNLDVELRERLGSEVRALLKESGITAVLVTHDQNEAFSMADEIGVMRNGRLEQWDKAFTLYHQPATRFVADFIGLGVFLPGQRYRPQATANPSDDMDSAAQAATLVRLELDAVSATAVHLGTEEPTLPSGGRRGADDEAIESLEAVESIDVLLRPDDIIFDAQSPLRAEVMRRQFRGPECLYTLRLPGGQEILALFPSRTTHAIGAHIGVRLDADHVVTFERPIGPRA